MISSASVVTLIIFGSAGLYVYGAWKMWRNFDRTQFNRTLATKVTMSAFWPVLYVVNAAYRQNFHRSLRGRD